MNFTLSICVLLAMGIQQTAQADSKLTDLGNIRVEAEVISGIVNADSYADKDVFGTGFYNGLQFPAHYIQLKASKIDCYAIFPIGTRSANESFFEKVGGTYQLKAGTKLVSIDRGFAVGGNWDSLSESTIVASRINIYLQIVGRTPRHANEKPGTDYDLVVSCRHLSKTDLNSMVENKWVIDVDEVQKTFTDKLSGILSITFREELIRGKNP